eukprot:g39318.t1
MKHLAHKEQKIHVQVSRTDPQAYRRRCAPPSGLPRLFKTSMVDRSLSLASEYRNLLVLICVACMCFLLRKHF